MKRKHLEATYEYKTPELTIVALETESGMVLCVSSVFEDLEFIDPDDEF